MKQKRAPGAADGKKRRFPVWKALLMFLLIVGYFILYRLILPFFPPIMYFNGGAAALLFVAFFIVNRGLDAKPVKAANLPKEWPREKKEAFVASDIKRKKIGRVMLWFLVPMLFAILLDYAVYFLYESETAPFYPGKKAAAFLRWPK